MRELDYWPSTSGHHMLHTIHWIYDNVFCSGCLFGWSDADLTHGIGQVRNQTSVFWGNELTSVFQLRRSLRSVGKLPSYSNNGRWTMVDGLFKRFLISGPSDCRFSAQPPPVAVSQSLAPVMITIKGRFDWEFGVLSTETGGWYWKQWRSSLRMPGDFG